MAPDEHGRAAMKPAYAARPATPTTVPAHEKEIRSRGSMGEGKGDILRADLLQHYQPSRHARGSWPVLQPAGGCERPVGQPSSWESLAQHAGKVQ